MDFQDWACPECRQPLEREADSRLSCRSCLKIFERVSGIWRFLSDDQRRHFAPFLEDYGRIRRAEGRDSPDPEFYRGLPERDLSGNFRREWKIRAAGFRELLESVIAPRLQGGRPRLVLADLGAGNCWLSHRLSGLGQDCLAVDLRTDCLDGLGCHLHYPHPMIPVEASFSRLPFAAASLDLVIFNASIHYAEDFEGTLREALRVLASGGRLVILDSPLYRSEESGRQMVRERESQFQARFGTSSNHLDCEHFLSWRRLHEVGDRLQIRWDFRLPRYGLAWRLRPHWARLLGRREPATFGLLVGTRRYNTSTL